MSRRVKDRSAGLIDDGSWDDNERVFGACAAAALYRCEMLDEISPDGQVLQNRSSVTMRMRISNRVAILEVLDSSQQSSIDCS